MRLPRHRGRRINGGLLKNFQLMRRGQRPPVAAEDEAAAPEGYVALMRELWAQDPVARPAFAEALARLRRMGAALAAHARAVQRMQQEAMARQRRQRQLVAMHSQAQAQAAVAFAQRQARLREQAELAEAIRRSMAGAGAGAAAGGGPGAAGWASCCSR